jgi:hypothetical protein
MSAVKTLAGEKVHRSRRVAEVCETRRDPEGGGGCSAPKKPEKRQQMPTNAVT